MQELTTIERPPVVNQFAIARLSTQELRDELRSAITLTAQSLSYLAAVWTELERRGEDLSKIRIGLATYLRDVAAGRLAPEAVLAFAGERRVLRWVREKPIREQVELANGKSVTVRSGDEVRELPATTLSAIDLKNVIEHESFNKPHETPQIAIQHERARTGPRREKIGGTISAQFTAGEFEEMKRRATRDGVTLMDLVRTALGLPKWMER